MNIILIKKLCFSKCSLLLDLYSDMLMGSLSDVYKVLDLYVWLSFRMEDSFPDRETAASQKAMCSL